MVGQVPGHIDIGARRQSVVEVGAAGTGQDGRGADRAVGGQPRRAGPHAQRRLHRPRQIGGGAVEAAAPPRPHQASSGGLVGGEPLGFVQAQRPRQRIRSAARRRVPVGVDGDHRHPPLEERERTALRPRPGGDRTQRPEDQGVVGEHEIHAEGQHLLHHRPGQLVRNRRLRDGAAETPDLKPGRVPSGGGAERRPPVDRLQYISHPDGHAGAAAGPTGPAGWESTHLRRRRKPPTPAPPTAAGSRGG